MFDPARPHNELPKLPPKLKLETERVLKKLIDVKASLAALREAGKSLPNQSVVLQSMVLQEAKLSSEIENIFTTNDELYSQVDLEEESQTPPIKEIRRYRHALWAGYEALKERGRIDTPLIVTIASTILEKQVTMRTGQGTRVGNAKTGKIVYTPPVGEDLIRDLLSNLLEFTRAYKGVDPLVRIAVAHYQFEAIHPFIDGNGRTGRVLNLLFMVQLGLLDVPVLYLSHEFLETRREYYASLVAVTERGEWEQWIEYFLDSVDVTAIVTRRQFSLMHDAIRNARDKVRKELPRWFPSDMVDLIFQKPYMRISDVVKAGIAKRQTAAQYLKNLEDIGLLKSSRKWREVLYLNEELLDIITLRAESLSELR